MASQRLCRTCNEVVTDGSEYCRRDGSELLGMACPRCWREYRLTDRHCAQDGESLRLFPATALRPIDFEGRVGIYGQTPLRITRTQIVLGGASVDTNRISRVRWGCLKEFYGCIRWHRTYKVAVGDDDHLLSMECAPVAGRDVDAACRFATIVSLVWQVAALRMARDMLRKVRSGESVNVAGVTISDRGVSFAPFAMWRARAPVTLLFEREEVFVSYTNGNLHIRDGGRDRWTSLDPRRVDNVVLVPAVVLTLKQAVTRVGLLSEECAIYDQFGAALQ